MSFKNSSAVPPWGVKLSSTQSSAADSTTSLADSLVIEDLDLADLDISPSSVKTCTPTTEEAETGDYVYYTEDGANSMFGEQVPTVISEACLMNDLYILVKVPTNPIRHVPTSNTASQTNPKSPGLSPPLYINSNRRIFCIQEEEDDHSVHSESSSKIPVRAKPRTKKSCWVQEIDEHEQFVSTTNIIRCSSNTDPLPNQVPEQLNEPVQPIFEVNHKNEPTPSQCQNEIELQEVNFNSVCFKGPGNVSLENYGILITPTKSPKTENLLVFQVDTEPKNKSRGTFSSCFEWFTKFFRRKRRRNGFVHAKVYKTYFVKWKKCSDDSDCPRCQCGTKKNPRRNSA